MLEPNASDVRLALIYGSIREGRLCDKIAEWAAKEIEERGGFSVDRVDPAKLSLGSGKPDQIGLKQRIEKADAFLIVTPEYNHSYPGPLKFLIDTLQEPWWAKPVGFVSYGGISGGLRAVEHLRLVFVELHAVAIRESVSFANVWSHFDESGRIVHPNGARKSMSVLLDRLKWWAIALREARAAMPYAS